MNQPNIYKLLSVILIITASFIYIQQTKAAVVVEFIQDVIEDAPWVGIVLGVLAVVTIGLGAMVLVGQVGLATMPGIFTTLVGTAIVVATGVGTSLWAADCLFDGSQIDPNIICTGKNGDENGNGNGNGEGSALQVDVKVNGSDGLISFRAPATFDIQWAIQGASESTTCSATGDWSGTIEYGSGETTISDVDKGDYNYGIECVKESEEVSDNVAVNVNNLPVCSFSASPKQIILPGKSILSWECQYANNCQISNGTTTPVGNISGTLEVKPDGTTTYILTCDNLDGPINLTTEVKVLTPDLHEIPPGG